MANAPQFVLDFSTLQKIGDDFAKRVGAAGPDDPAALGQQKLADAQTKLDALQLQRKRLDTDITLAQRNVQDATRLVQSVVVPKATAQPAPAKPAQPAPAKPVPAKPAAPKAAQTKAVETKAVETKAVETKATPKAKP